MISIDKDPANDGWIHSMRKVSKNEDIQKGGVGSGIKGHKTYRDSNTSALNISALAKIFGKVFYDRMKDTQEKYPEEKADKEYMQSLIESELQLSTVIPVKNSMSWLKNADEEGRIVDRSKKFRLKSSSIRRGCYYNAIDVVKKYHQEGYELAHGVLIDKERLNAWEASAKAGKNVGPVVNPFTPHAFVVKDGKVYDPTLGANKFDYYAYDIVPKEVWSKFAFKENDKDFHAEDFVNWIKEKLLRQGSKEIDIQKGVLGEGSFLDLINSLLGLLTHHKLEKEVISASHDGLRLGINTAKLDIGIDELEPDRESLARIGLRARALSDRTMSKARGDLAFNAEKLYQELDAAIESGMAEREALGKIRPRVGKLFTDALKPHELERLVRDQFLVATKEGRRSGWAQGDVKWRQWAIHSDSKTGEDSKRMKGQITGINEPYTDPKTGDKYMIEHIRPNDRCYGIPLFELPETTERGGLMYAKSIKNDFEKGGVGSGIKGHTTYRDDLKKMTKEQLVSENRKLYDNNPDFDDVLSMWFLGGKNNSSYLENYLTDIFGLKGSVNRNFSEISEYDNSDKVKADIKRMYLITQEYLKREHPSEIITLHRGVDGNTKEKLKGFKQGEKVPLSMYNVSSWTKKEGIAWGFAEKHRSGGVTVKAEVPINRILTIEGLDKLAYDNEQEAVVIGNNIDAKMGYTFDGGR